MHASFTNTASQAVTLDLVTTDSFEDWLSKQSEAIAAFARATGFKGQAEQLMLSPGEAGHIAQAAYGMGDGVDALVLAGASARLPEGVYQIGASPEGLDVSALHAGWADGAYRFEKYKSSDKTPPKLLIADGAQVEAASREANAIDLVRDLINTPAQDMGPTQIEQAARDLATAYEADIHVVTGEDLLTENYPMVHAVGRAAADAPRYIEVMWGPEDAPKLALVGKGVAFDTGGLNIKTGNYMRLMKKDMGGAAHALGLARMIMSAGLKVRLSVHVPTVENAVGADAFRPGDVLTSRKGLTVEIDNTDAEGRLILADALTRASELEPELVIDFATLTGAARVAMGPDVVPFFTRDDDLANGIAKSGAKLNDPVWRLPLWSPYMRMLKSNIADIVNGASSPFAGTITAALFLEKFVDAPSWAHFDVWGWRQARYGRPEGGAAMSLRAVLNHLKRNFAA